MTLPPTGAMRVPPQAILAGGSTLPEEVQADRDLNVGNHQEEKQECPILLSCPFILSPGHYRLRVPGG